MPWLGGLCGDAAEAVRAGCGVAVIYDLNRESHLCKEDLDRVVAKQRHVCWVCAGEELHRFHGAHRISGV